MENNFLYMYSIFTLDLNKPGGILEIDEKLMRKILESLYRLVNFILAFIFIIIIIIILMLFIQVTDITLPVMAVNLK